MRTTVTGGVRQLPSGRWQGRYLGADGKRYSKTFRTKRDAERWRDNVDIDISKGVWEPPDVVNARLAEATAAAMTLDEWVVKVINRRLVRARPKPITTTTAELYAKDYRLRIKAALGSVLLPNLTPAKVTAWYDSLDPRTAVSNGRSYDLLKSIMAEAVEDKLIDANPCRVKGAGKPKSPERSYMMEVDEATEYLDAVRPTKYRLPLSICLWGSLRVGEMLGLRRCDVNLDEGTVSVEQAVSRERDGEHSFRNRIAAPKTEAGRRPVTLPSSVVEALADYLATTSGAPEAFLFPGGDGHSPMARGTVRDAHKIGATAVGRPGMTVHDLRAIGLSLVADEGATVKELQDRAGHTTPTMALHYQRQSLQRDKALAARLDAKIRSTSN